MICGSSAARFVLAHARETFIAEMIRSAPRSPATRARLKILGRSSALSPHMSML